MESLCSTDQLERDIETIHLDDERGENKPDLTLKLPNEIWIKISSYLYIEDLCELCLVNWRFHHIAFDPILWTSISIKSDVISSTETVIKLLKRASLLSELKLHCRDDISSLLAAVSQFSTRLKVG